MRRHIHSIVARHGLKSSIAEGNLGGLSRLLNMMASKISRNYILHWRMAAHRGIVGYDVGDGDYDIFACGDADIARMRM